MPWSRVSWVGLLVLQDYGIDDVTTEAWHAPPHHPPNSVVSTMSCDICPLCGWNHTPTLSAAPCRNPSSLAAEVTDGAETRAGLIETVADTDDADDACILMICAPPWRSTTSFCRRRRRRHGDGAVRWADSWRRRCAASSWSPVPIARQRCRYFAVGLVRGRGLTCDRTGH